MNFLFAVIFTTAPGVCATSNFSTVGMKFKSGDTADSGAMEIIRSMSPISSGVGTNAGSFGVRMESGLKWWRGTPCYCFSNSERIGRLSIAEDKKLRVRDSQFLGILVFCSWRVRTKEASFDTLSWTGRTVHCTRSMLQAMKGIAFALILSGGNDFASLTGSPAVSGNFLGEHGRNVFSCLLNWWKWQRCRL